jgi:hypothetical protein
LSTTGKILVGLGVVVAASIAGSLVRRAYRRR